MEAPSTTARKAIAAIITEGRDSNGKAVYHVGVAWEDGTRTTRWYKPRTPIYHRPKAERLRDQLQERVDAGLAHPADIFGAPREDKAHDLAYCLSRAKRLAKDDAYVYVYTVGERYVVSKDEDAMHRGARHVLGRYSPAGEWEPCY